MAGTVEATVTAEKTDMCMVCNTHSEESTWCENHAMPEKLSVVLLWGRPDKWK